MKIALIAHDGKKADMVAFVMKRLDFFQREDVAIVATGTTGKMITHAGVTKVECVASGPMGGDAEIGARVTRGEIDGVIFFRDPLDKHPHDSFPFGSTPTKRAEKRPVHESNKDCASYDPDRQPIRRVFWSIC